MALGSPISELHDHAIQCYRDLIAAGLSPDEAKTTLCSGLSEWTRRAQDMHRLKMEAAKR